MTDINMLKAVVDSIDESDITHHDVVQGILHVLHETAESDPMWSPIYEVLRFNYAGNADWGDDA